MYFVESKIFHQDERGFIHSVIRSGEWREINYIESQKGAIRGGHYHKKTLECFFIIKGLIDISIENIKSGKTEKFTAKARDVFVVKPFEVHKFQVLEDSAWINILSIAMNEHEKDMFKP